MKKLIVTLMLALPLAAYAVDSEIELEPANVDLRNMGALQRGASLFVNYCMGCHSAEYLRWDQMGADIGLSAEQVQAYLQVTGDKSGDPMEIAMPAADSKRWFGVTPPDLSLVTRRRGEDWVFTYLLSFYLDEDRPLGANNKVFPDVGMPHALWELQGWQRPVYDDGEFTGFEQATEGRLSPEAYRNAARDLTTFLAYAGEPVRVERQRLGIYVILFLLVFLVFAVLLKRDYWKDVH